MKPIIASVFLVLLSITVLAQQSSETRTPDDKDQLALVRLRAQVLDAQARMKTAQDSYEKAQKEIQDIQPKFAQLLEAAKVKLPPPAKGKQWQVQDDGQMGVVFVQVDVPVSVKKGGDR